MKKKSSALRLRNTQYISKITYLFMKLYNEIEECDNALCTGDKTITCVGTNNIISLSCKNKFASINWFNYIVVDGCHARIWSVDLRTLERKYNISRNDKKDLQGNILFILRKIIKEKELEILQVIESVADKTQTTDYLFNLSGIQRISYSTKEELMEHVRKFNLRNEVEKTATAKQ